MTPPLCEICDAPAARMFRAADGAMRLCAGCYAAGVPANEQARGHATGAADSLAHAAPTGLEAEGERQTPDAAQWRRPVPFLEHDLPPFPCDALPEWVRTFVTEEATATQTPEDLAAMLALPVLAAAVAKKIAVRVRDGWTEPVNIFALTALRPAERKSVVYADATAPIYEHEAAEATRLAPEIAEAKARRKILEETLAQAQTAAARAKGDQRDALATEAAQLARELDAMRDPVSPRLVADDVTPEALATLLRDQGGRMAVMSAEGGVFGLMAGRYSANGAPNFEVYLKGHAGDALQVDRRGRREHVPAPALTLALAVQPDVIRGLAETPGFRGRGLLGRFCYSIPRSLLGRRDTNPPPVKTITLSTYRRNVLALLALACGTDENGAPAPHVVRLSAESSAHLDTFARWIEPQLALAGDLDCIADWAGKLAGAAVRIAGLLHMAKHAGTPAPWSVEIDGETMEGALRIAAYLIPHAQAAFAEMGADPEVEKARQVAEWIKRKGCDSFSERDAFQGLKGRFRRVADLRPALSLLEEHGYIRPRPEPEHRGRGRPPSPVYDVNPLWLSGAQNSHNPHNSDPVGVFEDSENSENGSSA